MPTELRAPYLDALRTGKRPYLSVRLFGPSGNSLGAIGIVDSGADVTCLPVMTSALLGLDKEDLEPSRVQQLGGAKAAFQARDPIRAQLDGVPDFEFELRPVFCEGHQGLWGRQDFFRAFEAITFYEAAQEFVITIP
ncbi:MAG TPA: hypothetical protein VFF79_07765 [Conexibacter sp.]|nr:hypothetical protein [Conexibacter sp.]